MSPFEELAQRLGTKNGHLCLGKDSRVAEAICLVLDLLEELKGRGDDEMVFDTTFSVKEAREENNVFGQIVYLRQTGVIKKPS